MMSRLNHTASIPTTYASGAALPRNPQGLLPAGCWPLPGGSRTLWIALKGLERFPKSSVIPLSWAYPVASWAHVRRYFVKAEPNYPIAQEMIDLIAQLYVLEAGVGSDADERKSIRQEKSKPIIDEIQAWLLLQHALPKSSLGKAITYTSKLWPGLKRFLDDPRVPLDNNATERSIRGIAVGRKNHYGSKSQRGTKVAALYYSLVESAKLTGIDSVTYIEEAARRAIANPGTATLPHDLI